MSDIKRIRQEIERLKEEYNEQVSARLISESLVSMGKVEALNKVLAFIDSLPEEKPSEDLEEAAWDCVLDSIDVNNPVLLPKYKELLLYLFIAGAEWQARQLLKGSPLPEDTVLFQKGVEEGKRLMMKEAVEGEIGYWNQTGLSIRLDQSLEKLGYDMDTKVKIIIVKQ